MQELGHFCSILKNLRIKTFNDLNRQCTLLRRLAIVNLQEPEVGQKWLLGLVLSDSWKSFACIRFF